MSSVKGRTGPTRQDKVIDLSSTRDKGVKRKRTENYINYFQPAVYRGKRQARASNVFATLGKEARDSRKTVAPAAPLIQLDDSRDASALEGPSSPVVTFSSVESRRARPEPPSKASPSNRGQRRWVLNQDSEEDPGSSEASSNALEFTLLTYNVLSQKYADTCSYLYRHASQSDMSWPNRWALLAAELADLDADLLCFQEIEADAFRDNFQPFLEAKGYEGHFKQKTEAARTDGCAIFYRRSKFYLLSLLGVDFEVPDSSSRVLQHPQIGLIAVLCPVGVGSASRFLLATTHLIFNPNRGDTKLAQLALFLAALDREAYDPARKRHDPVLFCGDLNLEPISPLYNFIASGRIRYSGASMRELSGQGRLGGALMPPVLLPPSLPVGPNCIHHSAAFGRVPPGSAWLGGLESAGTLSHPLALVSVYRHQTAGREPEVTTWHRDSGNVDYIFYGVLSRRAAIRRVDGDDVVVVSEVVEGRLRCLARWALQSRAEIGSQLPNGRAGSDHVPLLAKFRLAH